MFRNGVRSLMARAGLGAADSAPGEPRAAWWAQTDYHGPREVRPGRWLYTCRRGSGLYTLGSCSPDCRHATPDEAEEHYRAFLLDSARFGGRWPGKQHGCAVCGTWTNRFAILASYVTHPLCTEHLNRDGLQRVLGPG